MVAVGVVAYQSSPGEISYTYGRSVLPLPNSALRSHSLHKKYRGAYSFTIHMDLGPALATSNRALHIHSLSLFPIIFPLSQKEELGATITPTKKVPGDDMGEFARYMWDQDKGESGLFKYHNDKMREKDWDDPLVNQKR